MRPLTAVLALAVLFTAGSAAAQTPVAIPPDPSGAYTFVMPSGNVACIYTPPGGSAVYVPLDGGPELSCDRAAPTYLRFTLARSGPAMVLGDVGDPSCCGGTSVLPYGTSLQLPPFTCTSAQNGLTCKRADGNGFFISKARIEAY